MYHRICKDGEGEPSSFVVNVDVFERQLEYFFTQGYYTPPLGEVLTNSHTASSGKRKPLIITFDDGYLDNLENAAPLLQRYGFIANVFIIADFSRRTNWWDTPKNIAEAKLMEKDQVLSLRSMGIEIGSHGWSHRSLPLLDDVDLENEFVQSRRAAEDLLQTPVKYFAYPYGEVDERVKAAARKAGYVCAFATNSGPMSFHGDLLQVRRTIICNRADSMYLFAKLAGHEKAFRIGWSITKDVIGRKPRYNKFD